jgi:flagellar L-ring protein precursor FlgH
MKPHLLLLLLAAAPAAAAAQLYPHDNWAAMASDRRASAVGDILTVIVLENNNASNTVQTGTNRNTQIGGNITAGSNNALNESASAGLRGQFDGAGQTARAGRMVAQISVRIEQVYPNGDLGIAGASALNIGGERTNIRIRGRVRPTDITGTNTILSGRIADAQIDYEGRGFVSRSARPGILQRIFGFLGIM